MLSSPPRRELRRGIGPRAGKPRHREEATHSSEQSPEPLVPSGRGSRDVTKAQGARVPGPLQDRALPRISPFLGLSAACWPESEDEHPGVLHTPPRAKELSARLGSRAAPGVCATRVGKLTTRSPEVSGAQGGEERRTGLATAPPGPGNARKTDARQNKTQAPQSRDRVCGPRPRDPQEGAEPPGRWGAPGRPSRTFSVHRRAGGRGSERTGTASSIAGGRPRGEALLLRPERLGSRVRGERSWLQPHPVPLTTPLSPERPPLQGGAKSRTGLRKADSPPATPPTLAGVFSDPKEGCGLCV
ncbi:unnamed protein product [Rangifer tarandus platyrhynchus]|uniref:Uncharacterized protein n=1 Tax=Rangifer tarandus platyrhynchus TaxID=3082113 RepID=A0ABN8Z8Q0_RANTA|nr:unnamed protein product [Rangifer tarandus platyrhynchus]CAI9688584.1 unnamed protein product [Rangifer tarandus platyrhynchus]